MPGKLVNCVSGLQTESKYTTKYNNLSILLRRLWPDTRNRMKRSVGVVWNCCMGVVWLNRMIRLVGVVWINNINEDLPPFPKGPVQVGKCPYLCAAGQTSQLENSCPCLCFICSTASQTCVTNKHTNKLNKHLHIYIHRLYIHTCIYIYIYKHIHM